MTRKKGYEVNNRCKVELEKAGKNYKVILIAEADNGYLTIEYEMGKNYFEVKDCKIEEKIDIFELIFD